MAYRYIGSWNPDTLKIGSIEPSTGADQDCDGVRCRHARLVVSLGSLNEGLEVLLEIGV